MSLFPDYATVHDIEDVNLRSEALELARKALAGGSSHIGVGAVRVYDRKGQETFDDVHHARNTSYGSPSDPLVLFLKIELDGLDEEAKAFIHRAEDLRIGTERALLEAKRSEIDSQIARLQAERDSL